MSIKETDAITNMFFKMLKTAILNLQAKISLQQKQINKTKPSLMYNIIENTKAALKSQLLMKPIVISLSSWIPIPLLPQFEDQEFGHYALAMRLKHLDVVPQFPSPANNYVYFHKGKGGRVGTKEDILLLMRTHLPSIFFNS